MNHPETPNPQPPIDDQARTELEAYLDGRLNAQQRAVFEQRIRDEPALSIAWRLQQRIDESLGRRLSDELNRVATPPGLIRDRLKQGESKTTPFWRKGPLRSPALRWAAVGGLAAAIVLSAALPMLLSRPDGYQNPRYVDVAAFYEDKVDAGFEPDWVCDSQRFTETIQDKLARTLTLKPMPTDRRMLGLSYVPRARSDSVVMLGRHNDRPLLVFFDLGNLVEQFYELEAGAGLHVHQRDLGDLRAVEVSPYAEPVFLDYLSRPGLDTDARPGADDGLD